MNEDTFAVFTSTITSHFRNYWAESNSLAFWRQEVLKFLPVILRKARRQSEKVTLDSFERKPGRLSPEYRFMLAKLTPHFAEQFPKMVNEFAFTRLVFLFEATLTRALELILTRKPDLEVKGTKKNPALKDKMRALKNYYRRERFLKDILGLSFLDRDFTPDFVREIHQVRHILVHKNGIVDQDFKDRVNTPLVVGERIDVSNAYLDRAFPNMNMAATYINQSLNECEVLR
jgi:hypothetical protein